MKVRDAAIARVLDQVLLAGRLRLQAWLLRNRAAEPRAEEHGLHVVGGLEKLELYLRGCEWIGRFEAHAAAPLRLQVDRCDHEARPRVGNDAEKMLGPDHPAVGRSLSNLLALSFAERDWARAVEY